MNGEKLFRRVAQIAFRASESGTAEDYRQLEALILEGPASQQALVRYMALRAHLHWQLSAPPGEGYADSEVVPSRAPNKVGVRAHGQKVVLLLGVVVCMLTTAWLWWPRPAAKLGKSLACEWKLPGAPSSLSQLYAGQRLDFSSGVLELNFADGTEILAHGACRMTVESASRLLLEEGTIAVLAPPEAREFRVQTQRGDIIAHGSRFAVQVNQDGRTQVHVRAGTVQTRLASSPSALPQSWKAGSAAELLAGSADSIEFDPDRFLWHLNYTGLVAAARPVVHWTFSSPRDGLVRNSAADHSHLRFKGDVRFVPGGTGHVVNFCDPDTPSHLWMKGPISALLGDEFSLEFAVHPDELRHSTLLAVKHWTDSRQLPVDSLIVELSGREFSNVTGREEDVFRVAYRETPSASPFQGITLLSPESVQPNRWYHIAVVKTKSQLSLWIDGQLVGSEEAHHGHLVEHHYVVLGDLLGKRDIPMRSQTERPFLGKMDDCAIYDRPLSQREIEDHAALMHAEVQ